MLPIYNRNNAVSETQVEAILHVNGDEKYVTLTSTMAYSDYVDKDYVDRKATYRSKPNMNDIQNNYTPEEIIDAYGVDVFENIIRKKKLERITNVTKL